MSRVWPCVVRVSTTLATSKTPTLEGELQVGYGHWMYLDKDFNRAAFAAAAEDVRTLIRRVEISLAGPWGKPNTLPIVEHDRIGFNGVNRTCACSGYHLQDTAPCPPDSYSGGAYLNEACGSFRMDFRSGTPLESMYHSNAWWFDFTTRRRPYDKMVMLAMIALKHHLGNSVEMGSKGRWDIEWGAGYDGLLGRQAQRRPKGAVEIYEHVFPERAPVQNVLNKEGEGA